MRDTYDRYSFLSSTPHRCPSAHFEVAHECATATSILRTQMQPELRKLAGSSAILDGGAVPMSANFSSVSSMQSRQLFFSLLVIINFSFGHPYADAQSSPNAQSTTPTEYFAPHETKQIEDASNYMTKSPESCRAAAAKGLADAEFVLGWFYEHGKGVAKDDRQAAWYYLAAAKQGNALAENNLGALYECGCGVSKSLREAARWYRAAAEQGNPVAQCNLASLLFFGHGVRRDYAQAAKWLRASAEQNYSYGQLSLFAMYYRGYGVEVDFSEAAKWARRAADQGNAQAEAKLGFLYEEGKGVPLDYVTAYKWYSLAVQAGDKESEARIKNLLQLMTGTQINQAEAILASQAKQQVGPPSNKESLTNTFVQIH